MTPDPGDVGLDILDPPPDDVCGMPTGRGPCILPGTHRDSCLPAPVRCHCNRPVPTSSACGCCCANHDLGVTA